MEYYNQIQTGLGNKFLSHFHTRVKTLVTHPHFAIRYDEIRVFVLKKFPYAVHFSVNDKLREVYILAIRHQAMKPK